MEKISSTKGDYRIAEIKIRGLWDVVDRQFSVFEDVNFLIGANGTGKTSVLSILSGVLLGDYNAVKDIWFSYFSVELRSPTNQSPVFVVVRRKSQGQYGYFHSATISFHESSVKTKPIIVDTIRPEGDNSAFFFDYALKASPSMNKAVSHLTQVTWLSLMRAQKSRSSEPYSVVITNPIDRHIEELANRFRAYMNRQKSKMEVARKEFDRNVFISLLTTRDGKEVIENCFKPEVESYQVEIGSLFHDLGYFSPETSAIINNFFHAHNNSVKAIRVARSQGQGFQINDFTNLTATAQLHDIIKHWKEYSKKVDDIRTPERKLTKFLDEFNEGKISVITDSGDIVLLRRTHRDGKPMQVINASELSSGEKQLFILLVEALLQEERPTIYMADEPELSLHVMWQEKIVDALRELNPNCQLVFATHSPDIVSHYQNKVIYFEGGNEQ